MKNCRIICHDKNASDPSFSSTIFITWNFMLKAGTWDPDDSSKTERSLEFVVMNFAAGVLGSGRIFWDKLSRIRGQSACSKSDSPIFVLSRSSLPALRKVLFKFSRDMEIFSVHVGDSCFFLRLSGVQGVEVPFLCNTGVLLLLLCDVALRSAATLRLVERGELLLLPPLLPRRGCSSAVTDN